MAVPTKTPGVLQLRAETATMAQLAAMLAAFLQSPVVDATGRTEPFALSLEFARDSSRATVGTEVPLASDPNGPSLLVALEKQAGVKLQAKKTTVEALVIDSVDRPSEN